ncbi:MAG: hypothetical protein NVS1B11_05270 [Terriglobales bacterium]
MKRLRFIHIRQIYMRSAFKLIFVLLACASALLVSSATAQQHTKRLILKDGSYQLATKWEVKGERVRYFSSERAEWEEVPNSMVDWQATDKYEQDRASGLKAPQGLKLNKEDEAEEKEDSARSPSVVPGLRLPSDGGIWLLDNYQSQPQLVELQQSNGEVNRNTKRNILRGAINPVGGSKQTIELDGLHSPVSAHAMLPSIYINESPAEDGAADGPDAENKNAGGNQPKPAPPLPWDRFHLVRLQTKQGKRVVGDIKIAVYGKASQEQDVVPTNAEKLTGDWIKLTPTKELESGEYAVVELLGKQGINLYVWDFRADPAAPANQLVVKPEPSEGAPKPEAPKSDQENSSQPVT